MKSIILILLVCMATAVHGQTYTNPIIHADYSDPDVCAVGGDFYMTASSFNCIPGLPVLHSRDLVHWTLINHALKNPLEPAEFFNQPQHGRGVWAPCIRYHKGEYHIYWGDPDFGIFMVKTKHPAGEWDRPILVKGGKGMIDPTPLWDDDGKAYIAYAWAGSRAKLNSIIVVCEMNQEGTKIISDPVLVYDGNDGVNHTIEGPKFYKRNGYYYLLAPAGGVRDGWQVALRSSNIYGPYESKIVMAQGDTDINGPHQGGWVETVTGESWFINFQDKGAYGRITHLQPMAWINDWPVIGEDKDGDGCGEPVRKYRKPDVGGKDYPAVSMATSDEFNTRTLGLQWQWHANYQDVFGFPSDLGFMRLYGHSLSEGFVNCWEVPNLLMQKFPSEEFTATTKLRITAKENGSKAGLMIMGWDYSHLSVARKGDVFILQQAICTDAEQKNPEQGMELVELSLGHQYEAGLYSNYVCDIYMRVSVNKGGMCQFSYSTDGKMFTPVGQAFKARQGKWIGAKVGLFAVNDYQVNNRGWLDIDWFRVHTASSYHTLDELDADTALDYCAAQVNRTLEELKGDRGIDYTMMPRNIMDSLTTWHLRKATKEEWTAGFWPGILWYDYEYTQDERIKAEAEKFTESLEFLSRTPAYDHDLGFLVFCSYGNGYRLTGNPLYKEVILATADTLATLFNPTVGTILSWPREVEPNNWPHNTIMDNMINLDMLFWAAKHGGNKCLYDIAMAHADKTMECHFRPDHTSYHVAVYDTITGNLIKGVTHQGYVDNSMWARGQAWAIYGYMICYRETQDPKYLDFLEAITHVYLDNLPEDYIPYWDFNAPDIPNAPRDASAAAVVASALMEAADFFKDGRNEKYWNAAVKMLKSLSSSHYQSGNKKPSFLLHATGHWPAGSEIDASIIYADYYYIEALMKYKKYAGRQD